MKIVHVCLNGTFTDKRNYQENVLSKCHAKFGNDVTVITNKWVQQDNGKPHIRDERDTYINEDGVKVIRLEFKNNKTIHKRFRKYNKLYETLEQEKPDFIFIHGVASQDSKTIAKYLKKHPNVKARADSHADLANSATNWISKNILHKIIWKHYAKKLVPYVEKFYGVLPARVDFLMEMYNLPKDKCELLVMGADDEFVTSAQNKNVTKAIREKYGIAEDDFLIATGGKINNRRMQTLFLMEAVQKIDNPKVKLIVFGSVTEDIMPNVQELSDGNKVQYIGWVDAMDTYKYFASSDLVVFPGRHSVFWEQVVAQGIPMLCKHFEGMHHIDVGGNVKFLTDDSVDEIKNSIEELVNNETEYQKMKEVAKTKGMETFSYEKIAKRCIS